MPINRCQKTEHPKRLTRCEQAHYNPIPTFIKYHKKKQLFKKLYFICGTKATLILLSYLYENHWAIPIIR